MRKFTVSQRNSVPLNNSLTLLDLIQTIGCRHLHPISLAEQLQQAVGQWQAHEEDQQ